MSKYIDPRGKLLRWPDRLAAWRAGLPFAPVGVELDLTNRCNLGCDFCHFGYTHTRGPLVSRRETTKRQRTDFEAMGDEFDLHLLFKVLTDMAKAGVRSVTYTGGGEPTLYPHFGAAVMRAKDVGLKLGLYTNATRIDGQLAQLIKLTFEWVVVSLDAADAASYRELKQVDAFDKALQGIRALTAAPGEGKVGVSFLLDADNWSQAGDMVSLARGLGATYAEFRPVVHFDLDAPGTSSADTHWIDRTWSTLAVLQQYEDVHVSADKFDRLRHWSGHGYATCHSVQFSGVITPNGKMWTCVNRRGFPESCIGDLAEEEFADVIARQKPFAVNAKCRVLCRGDALNRALDELAQPRPHETFL